MFDGDTCVVLSATEPRTLEFAGQPLAEMLEDASWDALEEAVAIAEPQTLTLFALDGRTLEAAVKHDGGGIRLSVHDVSHHVEQTDRFARMALQLHRRNRDLQTLYDTTAALGETLDVQALMSTVCNALRDYLRASAVQVEVAGGRVSRQVDVPGDHFVVRSLETPRGTVGTVTWWRDRELSPEEEQVVAVLLRRAAVSIDHALLLAAPGDEQGERGLLSAPAARRRLAGFARPFSVMVLRPAAAGRDAYDALVEAVLPGRARDVKAEWGPGHVLVALEHADRHAAAGWLERARARLGAGHDWHVGLVEVHDDIDAAIAEAVSHCRASEGLGTLPDRSRV